MKVSSPREDLSAARQAEEGPEGGRRARALKNEVQAEI